MPDGTTRDLPMQTRDASFAPATADAEARTIELVWTTGARVPRYDWYRERRYVEELVVTPEAVDMTRLNNGATLLDSHRTWGLGGVLGVVERAWLVNGEGRAVVRFSDREDLAPLWRDVRSGIIRNVSVGYMIRKVEVVEEEGKPPLYRVVDWQPYEISLVAVGADAGAGTRDGSHPLHPCEFVTRQEDKTMDPINPAGDPAPADPATRGNPPAPAPAADPPPAAPSEAAIRAAVRAERERSAEITEIGRLAGLEEAAVRALIADDQVTVDVARARAFDALARRSPDIRSTVTVTQDERETLRGLVENALLHRYDSRSVTLEDGAREFRGLSLMEIGTELLRRGGVRTTGLGKMERAALVLGQDVRSGGMHGTADFPYILANVAGKTLRRAYEAAPQTFRPFTRATSLPDFKQVQRTALGDAPALLEVPENGEFTRGTVGEGKEVWSLLTYGRVLSITRQAIINDDMDAFTRIPAGFGRRAADLESDIVWSIITANAAMGDTVALFHTASHGNLASPASAPSVASLGRARTAMRKQTSMGGAFINVQPRYIMAPPELEVLVQQLLAGITATTTGAVNPFAGTLTPIIEPRLSANSQTAWYLAADPAQIDTIEYGYLQGQEGVYIETRMGFDVDGIDIKARHDFGAKAIDWRGLYKNAG